MVNSLAAVNRMAAGQQNNRATRIAGAIGNAVERMWGSAALLPAYGRLARMFEHNNQPTKGALQLNLDRPENHTRIHRYALNIGCKVPLIPQLREAGRLRGLAKEFEDAIVLASLFISVNTLWMVPLTLVLSPVIVEMTGRTNSTA